MAQKREIDVFMAADYSRRGKRNVSKTRPLAALLCGEFSNRQDAGGKVEDARALPKCVSTRRRRVR